MCKQAGRNRRMIVACVFVWLKKTLSTVTVKRGSMCCDIFCRRGSLNKNERTNDENGTGKSSSEIACYNLVTPVWGY